MASNLSNFDQQAFPSPLSLIDLGKGLGYLVATLVCFVLIPSCFGVSIGIFKIYKEFLSLMFMMVGRNSSAQYDDYDAIQDSHLDFDFQKTFEMVDVAMFADAAARAIIHDNVLKRFRREELPTWNLMARSYSSLYTMSRSFLILWLAGIIYRYCIQFPCRLLLMAITTSTLTFGVLIIRFLPNRLQALFAQRFNVTFCRISLGSMGIFANFHDIQNVPKSGIVVSNHTTPLDVLVLGSMHFYRFIGQIQPGYFAFLQRQLSNMGHIFFEREDHSDRSAVLDCLRKHASDPEMPPVIVFPEGTCINNTSVMQFRKGTFEICDVVHPVAIKYNPMFGDAFWDSSKMSYGWYCLHITSSWFLYCDVWFLPPLTKQPNEPASSFAGRVQKAIAEKAKIVNLDWDGNLKRASVPSYLKAKKQMEYSKSIIPFKN